VIGSSREALIDNSHGVGDPHFSLFCIVAAPYPAGITSFNTLENAHRHPLYQWWFWLIMVSYVLLTVCCGSRPVLFVVVSTGESA